MRRFIKIKDVLARIPVSRAHLYNMIADGRFPRQIKLGGHGAFWIEDEVDAWIQAYIDASGDRIGIHPMVGLPTGQPDLTVQVPL